jgi:SAM-dependent methyltransferase
MSTLYFQSQFPVLQNRVYEEQQKAMDCLKGDIKIIQDRKTGLIYNAAFNPELVIYDVNYNNEQGLSPSFRHQLAQVADLVKTSLEREALVEIGCGKGLFLEMLLERGVDVTGFDPSYEGKNPRVIKKYFESGIISKPVKGMILRHVLEHIPNPFNFLCQLRDANGGGGLIYIEVPCFEWIMRKRAWFDVFYEHVNYFRLSDFDRMFGQTIKKGRFFGEQYLYIVADLAFLRVPVFEGNHAVNFPRDFLDGVISTKEGKAGKKIVPVCIWGGASRGVIFSLLRKRAGLGIDAVIDLNPAKQGRFLPATGLKVLSPQNALDHLPRESLIYVMNSNYFQEIKSMSRNKFNYIGVNE